MRSIFRRYKLPLAVKSQVLFGLAAVLIIGAGLTVQFQRMEDLTDQLNFSAGSAVAWTEFARHASPGRVAPVASAIEVTEPAEGLQLASPQWLTSDDVALFDPESFEGLAWQRFSSNPQRSSFGRLINTDQQALFRYAQPLRVTGDCLRCHVARSDVASLVPKPDKATFEVSGDTTDALPLRVDSTGLAGILAIEIPSQIPQQQVVLNRVFLMVGGLSAGLLAVVVLSFILTRLILRPVKVLQDAAERVSAGDLNVRADIPSGDEFQQLAETFNRMLKGLAESDRQLRTLNKGLDSELNRISQTNEALAEANRLKSEFIASVSHELRTPLNSILGFANVLRDGFPAEDPKMVRYLQNIVASGNSLLELINDLLDLAKIEAGRLDVKLQPLSVGDLFEALESLLKPLLERKRLKLSVTVSADVPIIETDSARLRQILYNLLANAIKFSPDDQRIDLIASREDSAHIRISVIDRGPGIDPANHALIFERFRQLDAGYARKFGGTGLGLSISRELTMLLGGTIGVDSKLGDGAKFWVILPVEPLPS
jgi:signal transduction histidine kinase